MINGKAAIMEYFEMQQMPYFALFYKGQVEKGNAIFRNDKDGDADITFADAQSSFDKILRLQNNGNYTIIISDKRNVTNRGNARQDFSISSFDQPATTAPTPMAGIGAVSIDQVEAKAGEIAKKMFKELMDAKELSDTKAKNIELEKELKEMEKKVNDPINKFLNAASPHAPAIISGLFPGAANQAAVRLSGTTPDSVEGPNPADAQVIEDFLDSLAAAKPHDWQNILIKLTRLIKEDQTKFETALNFL